MAVRYTVYCKQSVARVTPKQLLAGVREVDLHTIAENDDIPDDAIASALGRLLIEDVKPGGFCWYRLCYRPEGLRQIDVERWQTPEEVRGVAVEVLEDMQNDGHPAFTRIRDHLEEIVDIVSASFGSSKGEEMAPILASEVTRWLAQKYEGIIRAADGSWWCLGKYGQYKPLRS